MPENDNNIYIYGRNPIKEALNNEAERMEKIFVRDSLHDSQLPDIFGLASQHRIPISHVPGSKLFELVGKVNDQGVVALMSQISYQDFGNWLDTVDTSTYPAVLLLDEIEDPGNLGAMLRTAAAAGIAAVLVPKHRQAPINATVHKTSAGTAGRIPIVRVGNLNQSIMKLKEEGFWICGLDMNGDQDLWDLEVDRPLAFVVGNEGSGISQKTLEHCDYKFRIPMENNVESLNASVSAALLCYEWKRKV
ncbi:23S rRNA (guanosine(2251)-2'-O)-methyltransferase RlmB [Fodinibius sp. SL11]|uniref:23S rRNA (guanosine(2251)-2'-O)-methyltransferase RlmB n=1 Tax=Fodinibius sp. SL11 TaxID=3425690 RepID=UPI003F883C9F